MDFDAEFLGRQLSHSSRQIIEKSLNAGDTVIHALNAIKVAYMSNRINDEEKATLKCFIRDRNVSISSSLSEKLTEGERACILSLNKSSDVKESFLEADYIRLKRRYRDDQKRDNHIRLSSLIEDSLSLLSSPSTTKVDSNGETQSCCVCGEDKPVSEGIKCCEGHFFCDDDLTAWVSAINDERENDPEKFRYRRGMITCPHAMTGLAGTVLPCPSGNYSHANICRHINDEDILEKYIEGIKHIQALTLFADYQLQVLTEIENLKSEIKNENAIEIDPTEKTVQQLRQLQATRDKCIKKQQKR